MRVQPRYAHGPGCWRKDRFVQFTVRGSYAFRYDVWGAFQGRSIPFYNTDVEGETPMQRAMFIRRAIDDVIDRMPPIQSLEEQAADGDARAGSGCAGERS